MPKQPAKYMVTMPPGAPIEGVGFVRPGEIFTAPSETFLPSRTFRPVNEEALEVLELVFEATAAKLKERLADATGERKSVIRAEMEALVKEGKEALQLVQIPRAEPKVEPGLTMAELGAQLKPTPADPGPAPGKSEDRKL